MTDTDAEFQWAGIAAYPRTSNGTGAHMHDDRPPVDPYADLTASLIDWPTFWADEQEPEQWLIEPLIPKGRAVALWAPAKAGKSTVVLEAVAAACTGKPIFGGRHQAQISVLYLDYEMTALDLRERLETMGYSEEIDMTRLHYALLPTLPPLDTDEGGLKLAMLAEHLAVDLVVVDTYGRAVVAPEDKADTTRAFYRWTGSRLKGLGIACLRTDHGGKDVEQGQRGSSAKNDDVDVVWRLEKKEGGVSRLHRTHSRMSWVPQSIELTRITDQASDVTAFKMTKGARGYGPGTKELVDDMDAAGVPIDIGRPRFRREYPDLKAKNSVIADAIRFRRERAEMASLEASKTAGTAPGTAQNRVLRGQLGTVRETPGQSMGTAPGTAGDRSRGQSPLGTRGQFPDPLDEGFDPDAYADLEWSDE